MKNICDPTFKYVPAAKQNLKATFARIRREMEVANRKAAAEALNRVIAKRTIGGVS